MLDDDLRSAKFLIVDDEPANVRLLERLLAQAGYSDIRSTTDPREAAALLDKLGERSYHAVLSDTRMPVLDGVGFYREIERRHPELHGRVAFMTGDTLSAEKREFSTGLERPA
jgi:putative two-component system response regulator